VTTGRSSFKIMLTRFLAYFARSKLPDASFDHPDLGSFDFVPEIGWGKSIDFDGHPIQIYLGSNGEIPNQSMLDCLRYWIDNWVKRRPGINEYIARKGRSWIPHDTPPEANELFLNSIEILWPENPWTCMIYFVLREDDERRFHVTFNGYVPTGFAYDH